MSRPAVYAVWIVITVLTVPMFMISAKELAPTEDQGGDIWDTDASANSTLDQNRRYTAAVNQAFMSVPETEFTFQVTFPNSGFIGMVVKPWDERDRDIFRILPEVQQNLHGITGIQAFRRLRSLEGASSLLKFVLASTADTSQISGLPSNCSLRQCKAACLPFRL